MKDPFIVAAPTLHNSLSFDLY